MAGKIKLVFGNLLKSFHQLWLEVTGTFLLIFAAGLGYYAVKEYRKFPETNESVWVIVAAAGLSILTLGFGIHSFWKSRKLR
jgi:glycerol uptake facilitator-like aquaporin